MRRIVSVVAMVGALFAVTIPAMADYPPEVIVEPGDSVQVIDGIYIQVETNGTVSVTDGIFVEKYSLGGQPLSISIAAENVEMTLIPGGYCDPKLC
jgi:hypothetical protein